MVSVVFMDVFDSEVIYEKGECDGAGNMLPQTGRVGYIEIRRPIYGLPQAGKLANTALKEHLAPYGYFEVSHMPGLWRHITRPIALSLIVDDFGVKYAHKDNADHLAN